MFEKRLYETVVMSTCVLSGQAEPFSVHYYLFSEEDGEENKKVYGVFVEKEYTERKNNKRAVSPVVLLTGTKEEAVSILEIIVKGKVTPVGFFDIICDRFSCFSG